jgi:hypothetical protein
MLGIEKLKSDLSEIIWESIGGGAGGQRIMGYVEDRGPG